MPARLLTQNAIEWNRPPLAKPEIPSNNSSPFLTSDDRFKENPPMHIGDLTAKFLAYCFRHRAPATLAFYRTRLRQFCRKYNERNFASLTPLEVDECLAEVGTGMCLEREWGTESSLIR